MSKKTQNKKENNSVNIPTLQFSVLCDGVATAQELGNKPVFIGVFSSILKPMTIPQFFVINRWINGEGKFKQQVTILDPELKTITNIEPQEFNLPSKVANADIVTGFINLSFEKAGVYWIKVSINDELAISYPLPVFNQ